MKTGYSRFVMLAVLLIVAVAGTAAINSGYREARSVEIAEKFQLLAGLRRSALETYFNTARAEVSFWSVSPRIHAAMLDITAGWLMLGADPGAEVRRLYMEQTDAVAALRVIENAGDGSRYSEAHAEVHAFAREFVTERGYYDFFLIDLDGNVVYTVEKEDDFGTSLRDGPYADTGLADIFARIIAADDDQVVLSDFESYAPSAGDPAIFAGRLMRDAEGRRLGVLALQLPSDTIQETMRFTTGMGESGETYLVGRDFLMRSDSRFSTESTVLRTRVDTPTVAKALAGEQGIDTVADYRGIEVLSAYDFIEFDGVRWAVMAEIDSAEVDGMVGSIYSEVLAAALSIIALLLGSIWVFRDLADPGAAQVNSDIDLDGGA